MRRFLALTFLLISFATFPIAGLAYSSEICMGGAQCKPVVNGNANVCQECEVGKFMVGISADCGNNGNCTLGDLMIVVGDVGNFVVGIVGVALLVMYVYGGYKIMISQGGAKLGEGKKIITGATLGFIIVLVAYVGVTWIIGVVADPEIFSESGDVFSCTAEYEGKSCGKFKACKSGVCVSKCSTDYPGRSCKELVDGNAPLCEISASYCGEGEGCCP